MKVAKFSEIEADFVQFVTDIKYATMITVDKQGRPRARVLVPIWQVYENELVGWIATYRTPVKVAHLANNPHMTTSYWSPRQNVAYVDCVASWAEDPKVKAEVWRLYQKGSPRGLGYDPGAYWRGGPTDPTYHVLRLDAWRVQVMHGQDLVTGRPSRIWEAPAAKRA